MDQPSVADMHLQQGSLDTCNPAGPLSGISCIPIKYIQIRLIKDKAFVISLRRDETSAIGYTHRIRQERSIVPGLAFSFNA